MLLIKDCLQNKEFDNDKFYDFRQFSLYFPYILIVRSWLTDHSDVSNAFPLTPCHVNILWQWLNKERRINHLFMSTDLRQWFVDSLIWDIILNLPNKYYFLVCYGSNDSEWLDSDVKLSLKLSAFLRSGQWCHHCSFSFI